MTKEKEGIIHIYSSNNNTIILLTDMTGAETIARSSGGQVVKAQHKEGSPYSAMKAAEIVAEIALQKKIRNVIVKIRGPGGNKSPNPGKGSEAAIISLTRNGLKIKAIENVTPKPHNGCKKKKRYRSKKGG